MSKIYFKTNDGFTLIELLAVIVILAIILLIAIPVVLGVVEESRLNAFKINSLMLFKAIEQESIIALTNGVEINIENLNISNMKDKIGIDSTNYSYIEATKFNDHIQLYIEGANAWGGYVFHGNEKEYLYGKKTPESCFVFNEAIGDIEDYLIENRGCTENVVIPSQINGIDVVSIEANNFWRAFNYYGIKSVIIPHTVTYIGAGAFQRNEIELLFFTNSLEHLGEYAFTENNITEIFIPNSVTTMQTGVFMHNNISKISIPIEFTEIPRRFLHDNSITEIEISSNITAIFQDGLSDNLLTKIRIPSTVLTLDYQSLRDNNLSTIIMEGSGTTVHGYALNDSNTHFRDTYLSNGAGTYVGTQIGTWTKVD